MRRFSLLQSLLLVGLFSFLFITCKQATYTSHNINSENSSSLPIGASGNETIEAPKYTFQLHLKAGDKYYYAIHTITDMNIEIQDKEIDNTTTSDIGLLYSVVADTADKYLIQITYKNLHTIIKKGDVTQELDADNKYSFNATEKLLSGLKDQSIFITINQKGKLLSIKGYKELANQIISQVQLSVENQGQELENQLANVLGEGFIEGNLTQEENVFSSSFLHTGDTWTKATTQLTPLPLSGTTQYKLENVDDDLAKISAITQLDTKNNKLPSIIGAQVATNLAGKSRTNYQLNIISGMIISESSKLGMSGTMQVMGREIPIKIIVEKTSDVKKI